MSERVRGAVKFFNENKGYGFIARDGGNDVFFHHTTMKVCGVSGLKGGETISFEIEDGRDGKPKAVALRLDP